MSATLEDDDAVVVCANKDCRVSETGRCVEALELNVCPHYGKPPSDSKGVSETGAEEEMQPEAGVQLPSADTLDCGQASEVLRSTASRVIAIVGPSDTGKTSLVASLYDLFQDGPIGEIDFARSRTLHAFEQVCHDARAASRRGVPHRNRTPLGAVRFYHLEIEGGAALQKVALLLADRAGEEYRSATNDVSLAVDFPEVVRADTLTVLVDGKRLLDSGARHNLYSEILMIVQALIDGGVIESKVRVALVLTKNDLVELSAQKDRAAADFQRLLTAIRDLFGGSLGEIEPFKVAASPTSDNVARGSGLAELLHFWLRQPSQIAVDAQPIAPAGRAFSRLMPVALGQNHE